MGRNNSRASKIIKDDLNYVWHPFTHYREWTEEDVLVIDHARKNYLFDVNGKKYFDSNSSLWSNLLGHNVPEINNAIKKQLSKVAHSTFLGLTHEPAVALARELLAVARNGFAKVFFADSGSAAVEIALKIAFQYWKNSGSGAGEKEAFVAFDHAYHGDTVGAMSVGGIDLFHKVYKPLMFNVIRVPTTYNYRCPISTTLEGCAQHCIDHLEAVLKERHERIAGLVIEPMIQCAAGMVIQPKWFMKEIHKLCQKYEVLMIVDEIATGFGRTGKMFAIDHAGISPDIMCVGKGLTGGYLPVSAVLVNNAVFSKFKGGYDKTLYHGHTFTANQLGCAAALATLRLLQKKKYVDKVPKLAEYMAKRLEELKDLKNVGEIRQCGLIAGIELVKNKETKEPFAYEDRIGRKVCQEMLKYGIIARPLGNVLTIVLPLTVTTKEIDALIRSYKKAIVSVLG